VPFIVGLTGGIGSGKSAAADRFAAHGITVVDTDEIAHRVTRPGGSAIDAIRAAFGAGFIDDSGALDRSRMRAAVFSDPGSKARLEGILHPMIRSIAFAEARAAGSPYAVLVVPLLLESGAYASVVDRILVIDVDESVQVERTMRRSNIPESQVRAIMANQASRADRLAAASDVIRNDGDLEHLQRQVDKLHLEYLALAAESARNG
jgi:dephospho-CoA kinase